MFRVYGLLESCRISIQKRIFPVFVANGQKHSGNIYCAIMELYQNKLKAGKIQSRGEPDAWGNKMYDTIYKNPEDPSA